MNIVINCPHCNQEMVIQSEYVGQNVPCPTCTKEFAIPQGRPEEEVKAERAAAAGGAAAQPAAGAAADSAPAAGAAAPAEPKKEEKKKEKKPMPSKEELDKLLPGANKGKSGTKEEDKPGVRVKVIQHHNCVDMGVDLFGDIVGKFLSELDAKDIVSVTPVNYAYKTSTGEVLGDFGVMIIYNHVPKPKDAA